MIPVIWHSQDDGRGRYNCTTMLNSMFDTYECLHLSGLPRIPDGLPGAVMIVHGGRQLGSIDRVNMDLESLRWAIVICLGDEECSFPVEEIEHPNCRIWVQEPMPGRHDFADRFILDGYTPHTKKFVKELYDTTRDLDWVFAGQVTHARRRACRDALQSIDWGGVIIESKGYCQGVSIEEYHRLLFRAHIVPCPSGPFSPDSARVCEALECGAIPILDDLSPTRHEPGFWGMVLGPNHPLPVVQSWDTLPDVLREVKASWHERREEIAKWWLRYNMEFYAWLGQDLKELGV